MTADLVMLVSTRLAALLACLCASRRAACEDAVRRCETAADASRQVDDAMSALGDARVPEAQDAP